MYLYYTVLTLVFSFVAIRYQMQDFDGESFNEATSKQHTLPSSFIQSYSEYINARKWQERSHHRPVHVPVSSLRNNRGVIICVNLRRKRNVCSFCDVTGRAADLREARKAEVPEATRARAAALAGARVECGAFSSSSPPPPPSSRDKTCVTCRRHHTCSRVRTSPASVFVVVVTCRRSQ